MRIISRTKLKNFYSDHEDSCDALNNWWLKTKKSSWKSPGDVLLEFSNVRIINGERLTFNIRGNKYRLVVKVEYDHKQAVYVRWIGTHEDYNKIKVLEV